MAEIIIDISVKQIQKALLKFNCSGCKHWSGPQDKAIKPNTGICKIAGKNRNGMFFAPAGMLCGPKFYCNQFKPKK